MKRGLCWHCGKRRMVSIVKSDIFKDELGRCVPMAIRPRACVECAGKLAAVRAAQPPIVRSTTASSVTTTTQIEGDPVVVMRVPRPKKGGE